MERYEETHLLSAETGLLQPLSEANHRYSTPGVEYLLHPRGGEPEWGTPDNITKCSACGFEIKLREN